MANLHERDIKCFEPPSQWYTLAMSRKTGVYFVEFSKLFQDSDNQGATYHLSKWMYLNQVVTGAPSERIREHWIAERQQLSDTIKSRTGFYPEELFAKRNELLREMWHKHPDETYGIQFIIDKD